MIAYHPVSPLKSPVFSVLVPTWNNLSFLKLCVESLKKNSETEIQIVLHINEGNDGTREWAAENRIAFSYSLENIGVCKALNAAYSLAEADYIIYLNDDMYMCPGWDKALLVEIEKIGHAFFYLSGTMIEPIETGNPAVLSPYNFGRNPTEFKEEELLLNFQKLLKSDWQGASWPPSVVHRHLWNLIGGYSIEFSPGMYSDPDFSMKLYQAGVRIFKGVSKSRVYHFMSQSTGRITKNKGRIQFFRKWAMLPSTFYKYFLKMGSDYQGSVGSPAQTHKLRLARFKEKVLKVFS